MKQAIYKTIYWAAIICALIGIIICAAAPTWAGILTVGALAVVALFAGEGAGIYDTL